jgi:hypothetical protein
MPEISGSWSAWVSKRTVSIAAEATGVKRLRRSVQVSTWLTRLASEGGSQPFGRRRLRKRGWR